MVREVLTSAMKARGFKVLLLLLSAFCIPYALPIPAHSQSSTPPEFPSPTTVRFLAENSAPFRPIGAPITAMDPDPYDTLTYSLSGRDAELFNVGETSGQLEAVLPLDYETGWSYSVTVRATDNVGLYDTVTVNIEVTNVDEMGEIILSREVLYVGTELNAALTDPDGSISDVSWQWSVSIDETAWKDIPGAEAPNYSPTPEDMRQFLRVQAKYTDGHGPSKEAVTLFSTDLGFPVTNHPPEFPFSESGVRSASADASAGQQIGQPILASDLDRDLLTYWLSGDAAQLFVIGPHTGQLKTKASLNRQLEGRHFGGVHVFDGKGGSAYKAVRIDVGDVRVPAALPFIPASPSLGAEVPTPAPLTPREPNLGSDPKTALKTLQPDSAQAPATTPELAATLVGATEPASSLGLVKQGDPASAPVPVTLGKTDSATGANPPTQADREPVAALAAIKPPPPLEGASVSTVGPTDGMGPVASAESKGSGPLFSWLAGSFLGVVLLAGILVLLMRTKRGRKGDISLPPPTVGPERRIGELPLLVSQSGGDIDVKAGTDLVTSSQTENS